MHKEKNLMSIVQIKKEAQSGKASAPKSQSSSVEQLGAVSAVAWLQTLGPSQITHHPWQEGTEYALPLTNALISRMNVPLRFCITQIIAHTLLKYF